MFSIIDKSLLKTKIDYFLSQKLTFSNYYGIDLTDVECMEGLETLILKKNYEGYSRIYFLSNNSDQLIMLLSLLSANDIINIPSKTGISTDLQNILNKSGYLLYDTYMRLYNHNNKRHGKFIENFALIEDVPAIYNLIYSNFVPFTDHLPSRNELTEMVKNKQIFVNRQNNEITGVLGVEYGTSICYLSLLIDITEHRNGLFLLFNFFGYMASININKTYLWINCNNLKVIKMYQLMGYKEDGLKDFTFTKFPKDNSNNKVN